MIKVIGGIFFIADKFNCSALPCSAILIKGNAKLLFIELMFCIVLVIM
jgi:hypothetical protein